MEDSNTTNTPGFSEAKDNHFLIVGIGASAGGIEALRTFFANVPDDSGIAYVVILHLSPDHDSQLAEVLSNVSKITVSQVKEKATVQPNHVYVVPPNQHLEMMDGDIIVSPNLQVSERRAPVDIFFRSLAESHKAHAVAVVLSGTGANGSMGLKRIKENGGTVFVQNPREAEYSDMPRNSIATELVDEILNVADIPKKIIAYNSRIGKVDIPVRQHTLEEDQQAALREIFTQLRVRTGHDFTNYKRATVLRRIERRINVRELPSLSAYADFLIATPEEAQALLKDLLISVTNFFRDREAFYYLETAIIPRLLINKKEDSPLRVWIAGCATGEEAYSVAMLLTEQLDGAKEVPPVQIFATDIDETSLATAREGWYTLNNAADISPERLRRFFIAEEGGYRVKKELRENILFAVHNLMKDPPFSRLDMITCRNMLIYLNSTAQNRVMETFHFALKPGAYLFLGSSESVDGSNDLFAPVSKPFQIFQSREAARRVIPFPDISLPLDYPIKMPETEKNLKPKGDPEVRAMERISLGDLHQRLLEQYAPHSLVVNENNDIVHLSDGAGRFLQVAGGEPTQDVLKLIRQELRLELRTALYQAAQKGVNVEVKNLTVQTNGHSELINLHIRPVLRPDDTARGFTLILFETSQGKNKEDVMEIFPVGAETLTHQLEDEINNLKAQLRSTNEQFEVQTEELKASNEELQAMNEELRSAAEELETSREELQSINEELITVNQELKIKVEELSHSNNDFHNLINSADIGTIFLDRQFKVKMFTPAARQIFNLITADLGRPLTDITGELEYTELENDVEAVMEKLQTLEREVKVKGNNTYLMQISPYRTSEDHINGVVIAFVNITQRKNAEESLKKSLETTTEILESTSDAFYAIDADFAFTYINKKAEELWGKKRETLIGKNYFTELAGVADKEVFAIHREALAEKKVVHHEAELPQQNRWVDMSLYPNVSGGLSCYLRDVTERKKITDTLRNSEEHYRAIVNQATAGVSEMDTEGNFTMVNKHFCETLGYTAEELLTMNAKAITYPDDWPHCNELLRLAAANENKSYVNEKRLLCKDGTQVWITESISGIRSQDGKTISLVVVGIDITNRKTAEGALRDNEERYRIALEAGELATWDWNVLSNKVIWNEQHYRLFGINHKEDTIEPEYFLQFVYPEDITYVKNELIKVLGDAGVYSAEFRIRRKDNGKLRWMSGYGRVTERDTKGKPTRVSGVMFDTTERREAEDNLLATQNSLNTALEAAQMGVWTINLTYGYTDRSPRHDQLLGFSSWQEEWTSEKTKTYLLDEDKPKFDTAYEMLMTEGVFDLEVRVKQSDGSICWVCYYGRTFEGDNGKKDQAAGVIFDITDRKTVEKQKDEFLGIASHELKTPVTSIKAYAEILQEMFTQNNDLPSANLMSKLDNQVNRLTKLIKDLLDVTKVSEGQLHLTRQPFSITELIKNIVEDMQHTARLQRINVAMAALPDVVGDEERLGQVLTNLISNAIKYSGESKEILVNAWFEDNKVMISVQDFGIGMSPGTLDKLFARFFRSDNPAVRSHPGLGLGLFISMEIMRRHGGTITAQSEKEKGSVFTMILPLSLNE